MKVLFVMLHAGFVRNYESALRELVARGHQVHIACETGRTKVDDQPLLDQLIQHGDVTTGAAPVRAEGIREFLARSDRGAMRGSDAPVAGGRRDRWDALATTVRLVLDYLRYFEAEYAHAPKLKARAEKRLPRTLRAAADAVAWLGHGPRRALARILARVEAAIPVPDDITRFMREMAPDLLLVTPLVEFGSEQVDYVKCARSLGIPNALCVASWDNLTNKGVMRVIPDRVMVWNEAQRDEAVALHDVPPESIDITGAQIFDWWFDARPTRSRGEFCRRVGLPADRPFILYVGSSSFIAPDEAQFAAGWVDAVRRSPEPTLASAGILIRPHPTNSRRWWVLDRDRLGDVAIWPPIGAKHTPSEFTADYYDSLHYSAAVVGINTSAQIEAAILDRPVFTVLAPEFAHSQEGMPHFTHLLQAGGGLLIVGRTVAEHVEQLASIVAEPGATAARSRRFVEAFVRPHGLGHAATPIFVDAVERAARSAVAPAHESAAVRASRVLLIPFAALVRLLAEDRPLWILAIRYPLAATIQLWAGLIRLRAWSRDRSELAVKRARRTARTVVHEGSRWAQRTRQRVVKRGRRMTSVISRVFAAARR